MGQISMPDSVVTQAPPDEIHLQALQVLYRYLSSALGDPRLGVWSALVDRQAQDLIVQAAHVLRDDPACRAEPLGWGESPLEELDPRCLLESLPATAEEMNGAYEAMFGLLVSGNCPPYETEYIDSKLSFQRSQEMADLAGFYRAFGWSPSTKHPERPDHIALELQFMATLCGMQLEAADAEQAVVCRDAQAAFLADHLTWWTPALARLLTHHDPNGLYGATGRLLTALLPAHRALLQVPPHRRRAQPSFAERPEECDGCLVQPAELG
jgi:TorA maturation chaperone TorD